MRKIGSKAESDNGRKSKFNDLVTKELRARDMAVWDQTIDYLVRKF